MWIQLRSASKKSNLKKHKISSFIQECSFGLLEAACLCKPNIGENIFGGESVTYEGVGATKKWESYGNKKTLSKQSLAFYFHAMQTLTLVAHVHDEVIIEADPSMSLDRVCQQMSRVPPWAKGLSSGWLNANFIEKIHTSWWRRCFFEDY